MATTGPDTSSIGLDRRLLWLHTVLDVVHDGLDDHDRIVHHDADGEHQAEQREHVDGEPEDGEEDEGADERHRHRHERDERSPPVLEKDEDHEDDEPTGLEQRVNDLGDALGHRQRGVERHEVLHVAGEALRETGHFGLDPVGDVERVGPRNLEHGNDGRRRAVVASDRVVEHRAEFDPGDVLQPDLRPVRVGPDDDVAEFLFVQQTACVRTV